MHNGRLFARIMFLLMSAGGIFLLECYSLVTIWLHGSVRILEPNRPLLLLEIALALALAASSIFYACKVARLVRRDEGTAG